MKPNRILVSFFTILLCITSPIVGDSSSQKSIESCGLSALLAALAWLDYDLGSPRIRNAISTLPESEILELSELAATLKKCGIDSLYLPNIPRFNNIPGFGQRCVLIAHTIKQTSLGSVPHYEVLADYDLKTDRVTVIDQDLPALRFSWDVMAPRCTGPCLLVGDENCLVSTKAQLGLATPRTRLGSHVLRIGGTGLLLLSASVVLFKLTRKKRLYCVSNK